MLLTTKEKTLSPKLLFWFDLDGNIAYKVMQYIKTNG